MAGFFLWEANIPKLWEHSHQIVRDDNDQKAGGAKAYFYAAGTTTAITVYEDAGQSTPRTNPVVAADTGRFPAVYIPYDDVGYDERVTTSGGTQIWYETEIPNPDPIEAATDTVLDEEKVQTGHIHFELIQGTKTGFVRCAGRTMGDASSGAAERANADTEDLFTYLWNNLANAQAAVSGGRGASAAADFAAHKTITLPDMRGGMPVGLDDMGASAGNRFTGLTFIQGAATTPGSTVGQSTVTLTTAQLPVVTPAGTIGNTTQTGNISVSGSVSGTGANVTVGVTDTHSHNSKIAPVRSATAQSGSGVNNVWINAEVDTATSGTVAGAITAAVASTGIAAALTWAPTAQTFTGDAHNHTFTGTSFGSGSAHSNQPYSCLGTWFMKL